MFMMVITLVCGLPGFFFGIYACFSPTRSGLALFTILAVIVPTALGFVRHVLMWRGDAERLGFEANDPSWTWEVGYANLAIAITAALALVLSWGETTQAAIAILLGIYMIGAAVVHVMSRLRKPPAERKNIVMNVVFTCYYAALLLVIGFVLV